MLGLLLLQCLLASVILPESCRAWSCNNSRSRAVERHKDSSDTSSNVVERYKQDTDIHQQHTRRQAIITSTLIIMSNAALLPSTANADVTNKIASSTALRSLSISQRQLATKLLPVCQSNNYIGVKKVLRESPFDELRKDMLVVVRGGEDGSKADELLLAYKQLIKSLEAIDATASLGMRGTSRGVLGGLDMSEITGSPDSFQLGIEYEEIVKAMDVFISIGYEAGGIPVQYDSTNTKIGGIDVRSGKVEPRVL